MSSVVVPKLNLNSSRRVAPIRKSTSKFVKPLPHKTQTKITKKTSYKNDDKNSKVRNLYSRAQRIPSIQSKIPKHNELKSINNPQIQKSNTKNLLQISQSQSIKALDQNIKKSNAYLKLCKQFQNKKKKYNQQQQQLRKQLQQLDQQINTQKIAINKLNEKKQKLQKDLTDYTNQLIQLQQRNYELSWDAVARMNNQIRQQQQYEDLVNLEDVSRGLSIEELHKFIAKYSHKKIKPQTQSFKQDTEIQQNCCICCFDMQQNQLICSLTCGHSHHTQCIKQWLTVNKVCPLCRVQVKL